MRRSGAQVYQFWSETLNKTFTEKKNIRRKDFTIIVEEDDDSNRSVEPRGVQGHYGKPPPPRVVIAQGYFDIATGTLLDHLVYDLIV